MLKRTLFFGSPGKLSVKNTLLHYHPWEGAEERTFPLDDLTSNHNGELSMQVLYQNIAHFLKTSNHNNRPQSFLPTFDGNRDLLFQEKRFPGGYAGVGVADGDGPGAGLVVGGELESASAP